MKILRLDLRAFGPFSDVSLDLSCGSEGLHLIYGPNEAGKTSALRALRNLLYGIPGNTQDNFVHDYRNLRIGAMLQRRDGTQLEIVRRKGTKGTLLKADESEPLDESALHDFLGGCDQAQFETMFGIDHAGLIAGGQDIVRGQGEIGHVLFAAGAGISDLRAIRSSLERQAEELFKPGGSKPAVNQALSELNKARKLVRERVLPSSDWQKHKSALEDATARLRQVEEELSQLSRDRSRLQRLGGALPAIGRLKQCDEHLAAMKDVPLLPADFTETRRDTVAKLETARRAEQDAGAEIARLDAQIEGMAVPEGLIARAAQIEAIYKELSIYRKAQGDLPGLIVQRDHFEKEAADVLREMRPDLSLAQAESLRFSRRQQIEIQNLGNQHAALEKQLAQARAAIADTEERLSEIAAQLAQMPPPRDSAPLAEAVREARLQGNLSQQAASLTADVAAMDAQAAIDLKSLGLWSGPPEAVEELALPAAETIARFERAMADAKAEFARAEGQLEKAKTEAADIARQLEQHRLEGEVPSETDLAESRDRRDRLWQLVLKGWRGDPIETTQPDDDLAASFEEAVRNADDLADRLRREANRVANRAALQSHQTFLRQQSGEFARQHGEAAGKLRDTEASWRELWQASGISPLPPREMQTWVQRQQALARQVKELRQHAAALARLNADIAAHRERLQMRLAELCAGSTGFSRNCEEAPPKGGTTSADPSLDTLLARADAALDELKSAADERRQLDKENARLGKALSQAGAKFRQAESDLGEWRQKWSAAIEPLGLAADSSPLVVNSMVAQSGELFARLKDAEGYRERIENIGHDAQRFRDEAQRLLAAADSEQKALGQSLEPGQNLEDAIEELAARLRKAITDQKNLDLLQSQRKQHEGKRQQAHDLAESMAARLAALCKEAGGKTADDLPAIEASAAEAQRLRREREACQHQLLELAAGATLDELIEEAASISADALPGEIERIASAIADLERTRGELTETKGGEKAVLAGMDTSAAAAEAAEDAQDILARLESDVEHYLRLRLASAVLREGIERYRKKNEGPVLSRASELFRRLTLGSFDSLRIGFDDDRGEQVLEGARPDGRMIPPTAMSEGTCDQLYLALRLASLEAWLDRNEPLPLIVDDILVSFDDVRAAATLEVLAELSGRTQVIFFAHHEHLVELARRCVPRDALFVHRL